jgi:hypothetical protein
MSGKAVVEWFGRRGLSRLAFILFLPSCTSLTPNEEASFATTDTASSVSIAEDWVGLGSAISAARPLLDPTTGAQIYPAVLRCRVSARRRR